MPPLRDVAPLLPSHPDDRHRPGRTLFEVIATLAVLGVAALIATPVLRPIARRAVEPQRTAGSLVRILERARLTAATTRSSVLVAVNLRTGRVWTTVSPDRADARRTVSALEIGTGVTAEGAGELARVTFLPDGAVLGTPVRLRGPHGTIVVRPDSLTREVRRAAR